MTGPKCKAGQCKRVNPCVLCGIYLAGTRIYRDHIQMHIRELEAIEAGLEKD